jgi:glutamate carboxypeptidase
LLDPRSTLDYFDRRIRDILELVCDLIRLDVPTGDRQANRAFVDHYRRLLEECGVTCREHASPAGVHLVGDWPGPSCGEPPHVVFVVHSDTVWPSGESARRPPQERSGRLYGPGAVDMRGSLAFVVWFFRFLAEQRLRSGRRIRVFVSADEERGSLEARRFLLAEAPAAGTCLVLEPPQPGGALKVRRKGVGIYSLTFAGRAAHAGTHPEDGASAIDEMVRQIGFLHSLRDPAHGVTINIGQVEGGTASNVVASRARCSVDLRFTRPADGERVDGLIRSLMLEDPHVTLEVGGGIHFPPMAPDAHTEALIERAVAIARRVGLALRTDSSGGGSDGSLLSAHGVPTLDGLGLEGGGAHALDENIVVGKIPQRAAFLTHLALEI